MTPAPPFTEIRGNRPGKTLLVTAGMDGDEYAGIEAAFALAKEFGGGGFAGTLRIIPTMNVAGFEAGTSRNPEDGLFPKHVFPGNPRGSATHRLMHWLSSGPLVGADAWIDLHGGASDEHLNPFLWLYRTGNREIDAFVQEFANRSGAERVVLQRAGWGSKPRRLARLGCAYVMAESGQLGERDPADIGRHVAWTKGLMGELGMIEPGFAASVAPVVFSRVDERVATRDGAWQPPDERGDILWWKKAGFVHRGDTLVAVGRK